MNVRVQRLFAARRMASQSWKCPISTGGLPKEVSQTEIIPQPAYEQHETVAPATEKNIELQDLEAEKLEDSVARLESKFVSSVYWALGKGYEVGGHIKRATGTLQRHDETKRTPLFGEWGIPLSFNSYGGTVISTMPNFWLRDNCRCTKCVNQDTMQRAFDTFSIPQDVMPSEVVTEKQGLRVTWANDNHVSLYPWEWILKHRKNMQIDISGGVAKFKGRDPLEYWGSKIQPNPLRFITMRSWRMIKRKFGFCYVDDCPVSPEKTEELLQRIAFIRVTHYGGFYDFTSDLTMKDTAYTTLALPAHTDTTYFTDPAGLQMFHLLSHEQGEGGASLLVDGFKAAQTLFQESRQAYNILASTPISWHASGNEGITIIPAKKYSVLNFGDQGERRVSSKLLQIRWNNDDRGVVGLKEKRGMGAKKWYAAARLWNEILKRKDMEYWAQLKPGRPLIFDNWRVLHGRSAFAGKRRICGGYINHDDYVSRWRNTNYTREEAISQIL